MPLEAFCDLSPILDLFPDQSDSQNFTFSFCMAQLPFYRTYNFNLSRIKRFTVLYKPCGTPLMQMDKNKELKVHDACGRTAVPYDAGKEQAVERAGRLDQSSTLSVVLCFISYDSYLIIFIPASDIQW